MNIYNEYSATMLWLKMLAAKPDTYECLDGNGHKLAEIIERFFYRRILNIHDDDSHLSYGYGYETGYGDSYGEITITIKTKDTKQVYIKYLYDLNNDEYTYCWGVDQKSDAHAPKLC